MPKTVAIIGRLDLDNFGDVLLGRIFTQWLKECQLRVICPGASEVVAKQMQIDAIGDYSEADAVIYVGGGYFGEPPGRFKARMRWGRRLAKNIIFPGIKAILKKKPVAIIAPGYGPITNPIARIGSLILFYKAKQRSLRDTESIRFLKSYGYFGNIIETADSALSMTNTTLSDEANRIGEHWSQQAGDKKIVLLHLTQKAMNIPGAAHIIDSIKQLMNDDRYLFIAATDQSGTQGARDTEAFYEKTFGNTGRFVTSHYESIESLIGLIDVAHLAITTKLHVGILSLARGTPVMSFPYHDKTLRFYRQAGYESFCLPYNRWTKSNIESQFTRFHELSDTRINLEQALVDRALNNKKLVEEFAKQIQAL
ncbi:polysaccharide pyruvyl transferase family protein [Hahella ganghwensis]|uniref:polysaccharide pyruvyl transferase family protein n=1 Tax=Hahella ganghwensis TaxID=286420 RepID=UPI00036FB49A|nr:polysaccharide pyruvyl transferase family protein [Hahella ganghwensis]